MLDRVWVLVIEHRHGTEFTVHASQTRRLNGAFR